MKPLAPNNILNTLCFPVVLLMVLSVLTLAGAITALLETGFVILVFIVLVAWIGFGIRDTYNVFYDSEFIYLNGVMHRHKLSLTSIRRVRLDNEGMRVVGVTSWKYVIEFDRTVKARPLTVYQPAGAANVQNFVAVAKTLNPNLEFES
jgi:hypothetical protein